jgi:hypothetical protein
VTTCRPPTVTSTVLPSTRPCITDADVVAVATVFNPTVNDLPHTRTDADTFLWSVARQVLGFRSGRSGRQPAVIGLAFAEGDVPETDEWRDPDLQPRADLPARSARPRRVRRP